MADVPASFAVTQPGSAQRVERAERLLGITLPADYKRFLSTHDGGEGFVGDHYLVLWSADQLDGYNRDYNFPEFAPSFVGFGSTGGGEAFAFDLRSQPYAIVLMPFIGMEEEAAIIVAPRFDALIERMLTTESLF